MIELTFWKELILKKQMNQECDVCHYWFFLDKGSKFQMFVCNICHNLLMMSILLF